MFYLAVANYRLKVRFVLVYLHKCDTLHVLLLIFEPKPCLGLVFRHVSVFVYSIHVSKEYERALKYVRTLLKNEPGNNQAIELEKLIDKALKKGEHG